MSNCNTYIENDQPVYLIEIHSQTCEVVTVKETELEIVMPCHITINESGAGAGDALISKYEAAESINVNRAVAIDAAGRIFHADKDTLDDTLDIVGVSQQSGTIGQLVEVVEFGKLGGASLDVVGTNYWLGNNGVLLSSPPLSGDWLFIGTQLLDSEILVRIGEPTTRS